MNKEDYVLRIASATPVQLVVINHELIVAFLAEALDTADNPDEAPLFAYNIDKAKNGLLQLIEGLDFEVEIAHELYNLYLYANERLTKAFFERDLEISKAILVEIQEMFQTLLEGWQSIVDTPDDRILEEVVPDGHQVFAGLTYGRDGLSEYVKEDDSRGFKA